LPSSLIIFTCFTFKVIGIKNGKDEENLLFGSPVCWGGGQCAAGVQCKAGSNNDVSNSTHQCYASGGRIHSHVFCGMQLDIFLKEDTHLLGTTLQTGVALREDSSNEMHAICFACKQSLTNEDDDEANNEDDQRDVRGGTANINKDEDVSHQYAQRGKGKYHLPDSGSDGDGNDKEDEDTSDNSDDDKRADDKSADDESANVDEDDGKDEDNDKDEDNKEDEDADSDDDDKDEDVSQQLLFQQSQQSPVRGKDINAIKQHQQRGGKMHLQRAVGNSNKDDSNSNNNNNNDNNDNNNLTGDDNDDDNEDVSQHQQRGKNKNHVGGKQVGKMQKFIQGLPEEKHLRLTVSHKSPPKSCRLSIKLRKPMNHNDWEGRGKILQASIGKKMSKQVALKQADNIDGVFVQILPLLQLHSTNYSLIEMPDTKAISCNMSNFQLARIICESPQDNMLVKLRKEIENSLPSVLD
jgi:hypothetical protein